MPDINIEIDCNAAVGSLRPIWRSFGYDEINWTYTPRGKQVFREISKLSEQPYYIRCHHTFTSGNALSTPTKGSTNVCTAINAAGMKLDFTVLDQVLETFLANNCKPIMELGFMPDVLSNAPKPKPVYDYSGADLWGYPPKDYNKWQELVRATVSHCVEKWGAEEVSTWYFELWNEPDNPGFFRGSVRDYCRMYDHAVAGAEAALHSVRIGGPGLATDARFLNRFLKHCTRGRNAVTGKRGARLDFISFHAKGTDWPLKGQPFKMPSLQKIFAHLQDYERVLKNYPHFCDLPMLLDECDMAVATNFGMYDFPQFEFNNTEYFPVFVVRMAKYLWDFIAEKKLPIQFFTTWAFYFEGKRFFEGNRALFTNENIKKPIFTAFQLFERLGEIRLHCQIEPGQKAAPAYDSFPQVDALASREPDGAVDVLVWNFDENQKSTAKQIALQLKNLPAETAQFSVQQYQIDPENSNSYTAWQSLGKPQDPTKEQLATIRQRENLEMVKEMAAVPVRRNQAEYGLTLPAQSVVLLSFRHATVSD